MNKLEKGALKNESHQAISEDVENIFDFKFSKISENELRKKVPGKYLFIITNEFNILISNPGVFHGELKKVFGLEWGDVLGGGYIDVDGDGKVSVEFLSRYFTPKMIESVGGTLSIKDLAENRILKIFK